MIELNTIHAIGNSPYAAPYSVEITASCTGMPYTASDTTSAEASAESADIHAGLRSTPSIKNNTNTGMAAMSADAARLPATG